MDATVPGTSSGYCRKGVVLPESGVFNRQAQYFHHVLPRRLYNEHLKRLEEEGIHLKRSKFTKQEDEKILANWSEYALEFDLPIERVKERMIILMDEKVYDGSDKVFSEEEDQQLLQLYMEHKSFVKVAKSMEKPLRIVKSRIQYFRRQAKKENSHLAVWCLLPGSRDSFSVHRNSALLPDDGILTEDGHLFHHSDTKLLFEEHIQRLLEHNIVIKKGAFSKEETEQLCSNWRRFAVTHNLPKRSAAWIAGFGSCRLEDTKQVLSMINRVSEKPIFFANGKPDEAQEERIVFVKSTHFWPHMCQGLYNRSALSVQSRLRTLYDPIRFLEECSQDWTEEEDRELLRLHRTNKGNLMQLSQRLLKPYVTVCVRIQTLMNQSIEYRSTELGKLWSIVDKRVKGGAKNTIVKMLRGESVDVDWKDIGMGLGRNGEVTYNTWNRIVEELKKELEENDGNWDRALESIIPPVSYISPHDFALFIDFFLDENMENERIVWRIAVDERVKYEEKMIRLGLTGFWTGKYTGLRYCLTRLRNVRRVITRRLLDITNFPLTEKEVIRIVATSYRDNSNVHRHYYFMPLKSKILVKNLLNYTSLHYPSWNPPRKLIRYVENNHLKLFSRERENAEKREEKERQMYF